MINFLQVNLNRVYGAEARTKWETITQGLLKNGG